MADINDRRWDDEDTYWRENYRSRPYASSGEQAYDDYRPAYRYGYDAAGRYSGRDWNDVEADLSRDWESYKTREERPPGNRSRALFATPGID